MNEPRDTSLNSGLNTAFNAEQRPNQPLWSWPEREGRYSLMGVLNVTPDSFYDGGVYGHDAASSPLSSSGSNSRDALVERVVQRGLTMLDEGARYLDVGGESSRPGADPVSLEEELARVIPVIDALAARAPNAVISIDTVKPRVAAEALARGARVINDISGLTNPEMREVAAHYRAGVVIMHMRGTPKTMQRGDLSSPDIVEGVRAWLNNAVKLVNKSGITSDQIALDVGVGFGKTLEQNLALLRALPRFAELGLPLLIGASRKSMIGALCGAPASERLPGSLAAIIESRRRGGSIFRVHDVAESAQALTVAEAIAGRLNPSPAQGDLGPPSCSSSSLSSPSRS